MTDTLTYGKHALPQHDYSPTNEDPFFCDHVPSYRWRKLRSMIRRGALPVTRHAVTDYIVYRAATRSTLGMTGHHRERSYFLIPAATSPRHAA